MQLLLKDNRLPARDGKTALKSLAGPGVRTYDQSEI